MTTPVYPIATPIGDMLADFSVASLRHLESLEHIFVEAVNMPVVSFV